MRRTSGEQHLRSGPRRRRPLARAPIDTVAAIGFDATCSLVAVAAGGAPISVAEDGDPQRDIVMWMDHRAGGGGWRRSTPPATRHSPTWAAR